MVAKRNKKAPKYPGVKTSNPDHHMRYILSNPSRLTRHVARYGERGLIEVVLYRQKQRWSNLNKTSQLLTAAAIMPLRRIPYLDWLIEQVKMTRGVVQSDEDKALILFQQGIDEILAYSRHAMMLGPIAAAVLARHQIERWSSSILFSMGIKKASETPTPDEVANAFLKTSFDMKNVWQMLSGIIHGREGMIDLTTWESTECACYEERCLMLSPLFSLTSMGLRYVLFWIEQGLTLHVQDELGCPDLVPDKRPVDVLPNLDALHPTAHFTLLFQLDLHTLPRLQWATTIPNDYTQRLLQVPKWPPASGGDDLLMFAFASRRGRAINRAIAAFALESGTPKELFDDPDQVLFSKEIRKAIVCETAGLIALHSKLQGSVFLAHAASALRSAFVLWLEDDSHSMACVRVAIEAVAKARAWRLKMDQAIKLNAWESAPVGRWLDLAGYKRLKPLYGKINRFSHFVLAEESAKIRGLVDLLHDQTSSLNHIQLARGQIRQHVEYIAAIEISEWLKLVLPELELPFWRALGVSDATHLKRAVEHWMNYLWSQRKRVDDS